MRAFKFPLESLRTLRQQRERSAQQRYARALMECDQAAHLLQLAEGALRTGQLTVAGELRAGTTAARLVQLRSWCSVLEIRRNESAAACAEARRRAEEALRLMTAAARDREALDRFHDKSQRLWQRAVQAGEQKSFDELAVQRQSSLALEKSPLIT